VHDYFVLIPEGGGAAWYWHCVPSLLDWADRVIASIEERNEVTLVAQSMGAFTAALVCDRARQVIRTLVVVNAMIPFSGETGGGGGIELDGTRRIDAAKRGGYPIEFDLATYFLHDVPIGLAEEGAAHERQESGIALSERVNFPSAGCPNPRRG